MELIQYKIWGPLYSLFRVPSKFSKGKTCYSCLVFKKGLYNCKSNILLYNFMMNILYMSDFELRFVNLSWLFLKNKLFFNISINILR